MSNFKDLTGQTFGYLTVIKRVDPPLHIQSIAEKRKAFWLCKCSCGNEKIARGAKLRNGEIISCGCQKINSPDEARLASAKEVYRKRYSDGDLTFEQFLELSQQNCYYCNSPPNNCNNKRKRSKITNPDIIIEDGDFVYNGLDRRNNQLPHNVNNTVPCCSNCNTAKLDRSEKEFKDWLKRIFIHQKMILENE